MQSLAPFAVLVTLISCNFVRASTAFSSFTDFAGAPLVSVNGLNDSAQVTGFADIPPIGAEAYRWSATSLETAGIGSEGLAINNSGVIVGDAYVTLASGQIVRQAYYWSPGSNPVVIGALPGDNYSSAESINSSGQIVGSSTYSTPASGPVGPYHAFRWSPGSGFLALSGLGTDMTAYGINSLGHVVGTYTQGTQSGAFIYTDARGLQSIPTLGVQTATALAINDHDQVVGSARTPSGVGVPYVWSPTTGIQPIDSLGGSWATAHAINNSGQVVGYGFPTGNPTIPSQFGPPTPVVHAFYWDPQFGTIDLNPAGWIYSSAVAINASGQILGGGIDGSHHPHLFIVTLPPQILGDANHDGVVAFDDLLTVAQHYGQRGTYTDGDFDRNGTVDFGDLLILGQHYGQHVASTEVGAVGTVPETGWIPACALVFLLVRRPQRNRGGLRQ